MTPEQCKSIGLVPYAVYGGKVESFKVREHAQMAFSDPVLLKAFDTLFERLDEEKMYDALAGLICLHVGLRSEDVQEPPAFEQLAEMLVRDAVEKDVLLSAAVQNIEQLLELQSLRDLVRKLIGETQAFIAPMARIPQTDYVTNVLALIDSHPAAVKLSNQMPKLCDDEGCDHFGTAHVCISKEWKTQGDPRPRPEHYQAPKIVNGHVLYSDAGKEQSAPVQRTCETLCEDCPPVGYPTDKTRCIPCPRRAPVERTCATCGRDAVCGAYTAEDCGPERKLWQPCEDGTGSQEERP